MAACEPGGSCRTGWSSRFIARTETWISISAARMSRGVQATPYMQAERYRWSFTIRGRMPRWNLRPFLPTAGLVLEPGLDPLGLAEWSASICSRAAAKPFF